MQTPRTSTPALAAAALVMAIASPIAQAQTPPTPETTFNQTSTTAWTTPGNWDNGVPDPLNASLDDAKIADGKTAALSQGSLSANFFGTLTLGTNSTLNYASAGTNNGAGISGQIYFSNGSHLNYTSNNHNRSDVTFNVLSGATAQWTIAGADSLPAGSFVGDATTTLNFVQSGNSFLRSSTTDFLGTLNYKTNTTRTVNIQNNAATFVGPGVTNFDNNVRAVLQGAKLNDNTTIKLTGSSGGASSAKFDMGGVTETISSLIIDSPTGATATAPTLRGSNANSLTVTGTTIFQGTAGAVNIDSSLAALTNNVLTTDSMTFGGTGTWGVSGDGRIRLNDASGTRTITTNANVSASISNLLVGTQGFTKAGTGTLSLTGDLTNFSGNMTLSAGELFLDGTTGLGANNVVVTGNAQLRSNVTIPGVSVSTGGTLNVGGTTTVDTLTADSFALAAGTGIVFQFSDNGINDQIIAPSLDLSSIGIGGITITGISLGGYEAQIGDVFTLFTGSVTGFDANKFILDMPTLTGGRTWAIQEGSLNLVVVIPEPSSVLLSGFTLLGLVLRRRR